MNRREATIGFGGIVLGFLIATAVLLIAEQRGFRTDRVPAVRGAHLASILHDGRLKPISETLQREMSMNIALLEKEKLTSDDVHALRAIDKICRARGIVLTSEANAVLVKNGAKIE